MNQVSRAISMGELANRFDNFSGINLNVLQRRMKTIKFYGSTTILWQDGEIVVIREERTIKPADFDRLME